MSRVTLTKTESDLRSSGFAQLAVDAVCLTAVYVLMDRVILSATLPVEAYFGPSILMGLVGSPALAIAAVLGVVALLARRRELAWSSIEHGAQLRWFVAVVALVSAWTFSTYDINLYFGQEHLGDRVILLLLALLTLVHPAVTAVYLASLVAIASQFNYGMFGYDWLDKRLLFEILVAFLAFMSLRLIRRPPPALFLTFTISILVSDYVFSAIAKLRFGWIFREDLADLAVASHQNGWLAFVSTPEFISAVERWRWLGLPLMIVTVALEAAPIILLVNRRYAQIVVVGLVAMHCGIFAASGIFFWKWMLVLLLLLVLFRKKSAVSRQLFTASYLIVSVVLIVGAKWFTGAATLMWFDTPYNELYEIEAVGESGKHYRVARNFMAPYEIVFAQNRFWGLTTTKSLVGTYGTTSSAETLAGIRAARTPEDIARITAERGFGAFNENQAKQFDAFIAAFFGTLNDGFPKKSRIPLPEAPHHIWNFGREPTYRRQEPLTEVVVVYSRTLWLDGAVRTLNRDVVRRIDIPPDRESSAITREQRVYRARETKLDRDVAINVLPEEFDNEGAGSRARSTERRYWSIVSLP